MATKTMRVALTAAIGLTLAACHSTAYKVEGTSESLADGDTLFLSTDMWGGQPIDTAIANAGKFSFEGQTDTARIAFVHCPNNPTLDKPFFLEAGTIKLRLSEMPEQARTSGTANNRRLQRFMRQTVPIGMSIDSVAKRIGAGNMNVDELRCAMLCIDSLEAEFGHVVAECVEKSEEGAFRQFLLETYSDFIAPNEANTTRQAATE